MPQHPVVRIASFLVLAMFISLGSVPVLLTALAIVTLVYGGASAVERSEVKQLLWRMRWLFLSMGMAYFLFAPGDPWMASDWGRWLPTVEGTLEGLRRMAGLSLIVVLAYWLVNTTPRTQLIGAIHRLTSWLRFIGFSSERLAIRLHLILEAVPFMQASLTQRLSEISVRKRHPRELGQAVGSLVTSVLNDAETIPLDRIRFVEIGWPSLGQWLYPLGLLLFLVGIQVGL